MFKHKLTWKCRLELFLKAKGAGRWGGTERPTHRCDLRLRKSSLQVLFSSDELQAVFLYGHFSEKPKFHHPNCRCQSWKGHCNDFRSGGVNVAVRHLLLTSSHESTPPPSLLGSTISLQSLLWGNLRGRKLSGPLSAFETEADTKKSFRRSTQWNTWRINQSVSQSTTLIDSD